MSMVYSGDYVQFSDGTQMPSYPAGWRNRIINGEMRIDQRNAGASVTPTTDGTYTLDRFTTLLSQSSKFSVQQSSTAPAGFTKSMAITSLSAYSVGAAERFAIQHSVEGVNISDLAWGTADAQPVTVSFRVRSSLTGTFGGSVLNSAGALSYPFSYTINAANTWETKTVNIAGPTSGTWLTDTGNGLALRFSLGAGASVSGTAGSWQAGNLTSATGATSVVGTNGATFYITGVMLEKGSYSGDRPYDYVEYGESLRRCQRYLPCWRGDSGNQPIGIAVIDSGISGDYSVQHPVTTRVKPTGFYSSGSFFAFSNNSAYAATLGSLGDVSTSMSAIVFSSTGMVASTGLAIGQGAFVLYLTGCEL